MSFSHLSATAVVCVSLLVGCSGSGSGGAGEFSGAGIPGASGDYKVVAWNDLGMHCLNPSYDTAVILPPYNTVWAQVIKRGNPPQVVTSGITVSYRMIDNTSSSTKGFFGQFWTYALDLFGASPTLDKGLNLENPAISNGLSGTMVQKADHFVVNGIPVVPYSDSNPTVRNPYQVAEIVVKDGTGKIIAQTQTTVPTSDEINCAKCHAPGGSITATFTDILSKHDIKHGTTFTTQIPKKPVLCASCHGSPALNAPLQPGKPYLSYAIHNSHSTRGAACYDCHPGASTSCNRSVKHKPPYVTGECSNTSCHGDMATVAATIGSGTRVPWVDEPKCANNAGCHSTTIPQINIGTTLYRNAVGHGGIYCAGCHGSPHAMYPADTTGDKTGNYQPLQNQNRAMVLGDCRNCHGTSRGGGNNFANEHSGKLSACNICHSGFQNAANTALFPHAFQWKSR